MPTSPASPPARAPAHDMARPTVRLGEVSRRGDTAFTLAPDADERASLAQDLGIPHQHLRHQ
jgi:hypothetical protein